MSNKNQKVAIITGSTDGIGRATACLLARSGIAVVLNGRNEEKLAATIEAIKADGGTCLSVKGDITEQKVRDELISKTMDHFGRIDILVNNAGGSTHGHPFADISIQNWHDTMAFNLNYCFDIIQTVIPIMKKAGGGKIINVTSLAGRQHSILSGADYAARHHPMKLRAP